MSATAQSSSSKKRPAGPVSTESSQKIPKIHPFFKKASASTSDPSTLGESKVRWTTPALGPTKSCLHAVHFEPQPSNRVAAFDLDGTLIRDTKGKEWAWWTACAPDKMKSVHEEGYVVVIVTNQAGIKTPVQREEWKRKIESIAKKIPEVPFHLFAATARDGFRKPMIGMWRELERILGIPIDKTQSFYVGDAAGRKGDFASTDRKWAENVGILFYTPEEYFLKGSPVKYELPGFRASALPNHPQFLPTNTPVASLTDPEIVMFVGYPCLGKTTTFKRYFEPAGYVHVNQDTLKTRQKCVKAVEEYIKEGKSCVVDNTNRDSATRKCYLDLGKQNGIPVRCFLFTGSAELAWHNNLYRAYNLPPSVATAEMPRVALPYSAFASFAKDYHEPTMEEGFKEIKRVNWVFEGTNEERRHWEMWLQVDGK